MDVWIVVKNWNEVQSLDVIFWLREMVVGCNEMMECRSAYAGSSSTNSDRLLALGKTRILKLQQYKT
jgi:hypothetical protein